MLNAGTSIDLLDSEASADTRGPSSADAVLLDAPTVTLTNSALRALSDRGSTGDAGFVLVSGTDIRIEEGSGLSSRVSSDGGDAGGVILEGENSIEIASGSRLESSVIGRGDAGFIGLEAPSVTIVDAQLESTSSPQGGAGPVGSAGAIIAEGAVVEIATSTLTTTNAATRDEGASLIDLTATERLAITNARLESDTLGQATAGNILLSAPDLLLDAAVILAEAADGATGAAGNIDLRATDVRLENGVALASRALTPTSDAGTVTIRAESSARLGAESVIETSSTGAGSAGEITVSAPELALIDTTLRSASEAPIDAPPGPVAIGGAGSITLTGESVELDGATILTTNSATRPVAPSDVTITATERLRATDLVIEADTFGDSGAGTVRLSAPDLEISGVVASRALREARLPRSAEDLAAGLGFDGEGLAVQEFVATAVAALEAALELELGARTGPTLLAEILDRAPAAAVGALEEELNAAGTTLFALADLVRSPGSDAIGSAGEIRLAGTDVTVVDAALTTETEATLEGRPAGIALTATGALNVENTDLLASTSARANAGDISLAGATVLLTDTVASAESNENATGDAGAIVVTSAGELILRGSDLGSRSLSASGAAGSISLSGTRVDLDASSDAPSTLTTSSRGDGVAGDISVRADRLVLAGDTAVLSESFGAGASGAVFFDLGTRLDMTDSAVSTNALRARGGDITVITRGSEIFLTRSSFEASAGADGSGGNILLDTDFLVLRDSNVLATAVAGNGGKIDIFADAVVQDFFTVISADSETGNAGTVNIRAPDNDMNSVVNAQDASPLVVPELVSDRCAVDTGSTSRFVVRPATEVRSLPESPRALDDVEARLRVSSLFFAPCPSAGP